MGRVVRLAGLAALALPVIVLLGWVFYSRAAFGTWNPMARPAALRVTMLAVNGLVGKVAFAAVSLAVFASALRAVMNVFQSLG